MAEQNLGDLVVEVLDEWKPIIASAVENRWRLGGQRATVQVQATESPITVSPTTALPSGAVAEYMRRETQASSPLAPTTTESGRAEQSSGCVHQWVHVYASMGKLVTYEMAEMNRHWYNPLWCPKCGALWYDAKILVPAAAPTSSIYPRPGSAGFVALSEITAPSLSKESGERL